MPNDGGAERCADRFLFISHAWSQVWRQLLSIYEQLKDSKGQYHCHRRLARNSEAKCSPLDKRAAHAGCNSCRYSLAQRQQPRRLRAPHQERYAEAVLNCIASSMQGMLHVAAPGTLRFYFRKIECAKLEISSVRLVIVTCHDRS